MNNRLTIQDLAELLAEYTGKDKNDCEHFLREFIAVVSEGVYADKIVKVKGLGTFKIIPVEKRESIHVNTGERFVIPPHYKFSFLPDKNLREQVNKPFSFFETTELSENVDFNDIEVVPDEPEVKEPEDESVEEVIPEEKHLSEEEAIVSPKEEEDKSENLESEIQPEIKQETPEADKEPEAETISEIPENRLRTKRILLIAVFVFSLITFNMVLYLNRNHFFEKEDDPSPIPTAQDRPEALVTQVTEATEPKEPEETENAHPSPEIIARVKIEPGSRLTLIALKYYGSKLFWVYLYEHNKAVIKDPNNVPIGTVIEIPAPEKYGIDHRNRSSIEKAAARQTEILSGKL